MFPLFYRPDLLLADSRFLTEPEPGLPDSARVDEAPDTASATTEDFLPVPGSDDFPEIFIRLGAQSIGSCELTAFKRFNTVYLPISGVFQFVQVDITLASDLSSAAGFFLTPENRYECDFTKGIIRIEGKDIFLTASDFIIGETDVYLADHVYNNAFGIHFSFDELNMYVYLRATRKLPAVRAREREIARKYLDVYSGIIPPADKNMPRNRQLVNGVMVDWSVSHNQTIDQQASFGYNTGIGAEIAGGDFSGIVYGSNNSNIDWGRMPWHWRYVNDEWNALKQITIGNLATTTPGMYYSLRGVQVTNVPYVGRRGFATHVIEDRTYPNWEVELYLNNKLIEFHRTDSTGAFRFEIPISYGTTNITMKYYGPHGEERVDRRRVDIPFFLLPEGEFEYSAAAGQLNSLKMEPFAQISNSYGFSSYLTAGGGFQYSEKIGNPRYMPFGFATLRLPSNLLFNGEYLHKQWARGIMRLVSYDMPDVQLAYTQYDPGEFYNPMKLRHESRLSVLITPPRTWYLNGISLGAQEVSYENQSMVYGNVGLSFFIGQLFASLNTRAGWRGVNAFDRQTYLETTLSTHLALPFGVFFSGNADYDIAGSQLKSIRGTLTKRMFGELQVGLMFNRLFNPIETNIVQLTLALDLPFTRIQSQGVTSYGRTTLQTSFRGTAALDQGTSAVVTGNRNWLERSGISIVPFYDENNNDNLDAGETVLEQSTNARLTGRNFRSYKKNTFTRFYDLLPYHTYRLTIDPNTFADPLYNTQYKSYAITADPNQFKPVYIPVFVAGSVEGSIMRETMFDTAPQSGMRVFFEHIGSGHKYETTSFSDGSYFLFGLRPGKYRATLDTVQLNRVSMRQEPEEATFELKALPNGDTRMGVNFILKPAHKMAGLVPPDKVDDAIPVVRMVLGANQQARAEIVKEPVSLATAAPPIKTLPLSDTRTLLVDLDAPDFSEEDKIYLNRLAKTLKENPKLVAIVHGHSDNFGSFTESQRRSELRAEQIKKYLIQQGIPANVIYTRGFGARVPVVRNTSPDSRLKNNRVEIKIISSENPSDESNIMSRSGMDK